VLVVSGLGADAKLMGLFALPPATRSDATAL
jgi:hypothetical protein